MSLVIDASVAIKLLITEPDSRLAEDVLASGDQLIAPDLIACEVANILATKQKRGQISAAQARVAISALPKHFHAIVASLFLAPRALEIAAQLGHPAYDCFYLALGEARGATMITADERFVRALVDTGWQHQTTLLRDYGSRH